MVEGILTMVSDNPQLRVASITCGRSSSTKLRGFLRSNSKKNEAILHILILEYDPPNLYQVNHMFFSFPFLDRPIQMGQFFRVGVAMVNSTP